PLLKVVPQLVYNADRSKSYSRGGFLGKGGFARCYELTDQHSGAIVAGKIVSKLLLRKDSEKSKMVQEISIHRRLSHSHVVRLIDCFEDVDNVYVILELCKRRSLMELHKRRRGITEPEARYFTSQIADAVEYLHLNKVIHRDLKLGNIFINSEMSLKVGDFGLAATIDHEGERKQTLCGTPNYVAPEVLNKTGHSFEVDIWAIGCIIFTLIVGKPPFETKALQDTYARIRTNTFKIPCWVSSDARTLIAALLAADPNHRPPANKVRSHPFFRGHMPERLPTSCLTMPPKFTVEQAPPGALCSCCEQPASTGTPTRLAAPAAFPLRPVQQARGTPAVAEPLKSWLNRCIHMMKKKHSLSEWCHLTELLAQLTSLLKASDVKRDAVSDDICESPEAMPVYWISKWVVDSQFGIAYTLCDDSVGVLSHDATKLVTDAAAVQLSYMDEADVEEFHTMENYPAKITRKV
ncbi:hypothetical protein PMAYCL1PPCAC_13879, partial [Pristionchus mayeri]